MKPRFLRPLRVGAGPFAAHLVAVCLAAAIAAPAQAQQQSQPPQPQRTAEALGPIDEVVLYVQGDLKRQDFIQPLVCALRRVLVAPVNVADVDLPLGSELLVTPTQYDVGAIAQRVIESTAADGGARTFKYLLHPHDMKNFRFRYVFAMSYATAAPPHHVGVVSMKRLDVDDPGRSRDERAQIAAGRAYKLILKSVALLAGLPNTGGCILAYPRTLDELDQKSAEFCPADREALVAAKVLKAEESNGCVLVSENEGPQPHDLPNPHKKIAGRNAPPGN